MPVISGYPACCGASIITGFSGSPDSNVAGRTEFNVKTGRYEIINNGMKAGEKLLADIAKGYKNRLYTCILTSGQFRYWGKWLKANGFIFTNRFVNSVHNSTLYHFVYISQTKGRIKDIYEPPRGWKGYPGPTTDAELSKDEAIAQPSPDILAA